MEEKLNYRPIPQNLITKSKNYIFPINIEGKYGTCFFFKAILDIYLCISYDLISKEFIESQGIIKVNNKTIRLSNERKILSFENRCKLISINKGEVPDEYILQIDSPLGNYKNEDAFLFAYSYPFEEGGSGYIPGKIIKIERYKIFHEFNTKGLLCVSPICIIKDKQFKLVGIQLEDPDAQNYKYMGYGYSLSYILKSLNIPFIEENNNISINYLNVNGGEERMKFLGLFRENFGLSFYTFDQYKNGIYHLHFRISRFYNHQTPQNFNNYYNFVNKAIYYKYLYNLRLFKNINNNMINIFNNFEIARNFNEILLSNDEKKIRDFSYFIAGYIYVLNAYSLQMWCQYKNDGDLLYTRTKLTLKDLEGLDNNINKLITFKTFLIDIVSLEHIQGKLGALLMDFQNYFSFRDLNKFDTKIYIKHNYKQTWKASCFSVLSNKKIFNLFTFFKVVDVKIDYESKYAEVKLELVGKNVIFESEIGNKDIKFDINYIKKDNIIRIN